MVQLSNIVKAKEGVAPRDLRRFNQLRAITIQANLAPGYTLGEAIAAVEQAAADVLPQGTLTDLTGQAREFRDASSNLPLVFVLALAFIYLVLSAQFESFRDPADDHGVGAAVDDRARLRALWLTGGTLNVYSQIGLVTLIGLITKHGILIVDFANKLQDEGMERRAAIIEAARLRLRPDPDDHRGDDPRRRSAGACHGCRCRKPPADRLGDRRRHEPRHAAHAVRGALRLCGDGLAAEEGRVCNGDAVPHAAEECRRSMGLSGVPYEPRIPGPSRRRNERWAIHSSRFSPSSGSSSSAGIA